MSGGHFDYFQFRIRDRASELDEMIHRCQTAEEDEYGYKPDYSPETLEKFAECAATMRKAAEMLHRVDWLVSGDNGEVTFHELWEKNVNQCDHRESGG